MIVGTKMAESQANSEASHDTASTGKPSTKRLFRGMQAVSVCFHPLKQAVLVVVSCVSNVYGQLKPAAIACTSSALKAAPNDVEIVVRSKRTSEKTAEQETTQDQSYIMWPAKKMLELIGQHTPNSVKLVGIYSGVLSAQMMNLCENTKICAFKVKDSSLLAALKKYMPRSCSSVLTTWLIPSMLDAAEMFNCAVDYLKGHHFPLNSYIPMIPVEEIELAFEKLDSWAAPDNSETPQLENLKAEEDENAGTING
eukprot:Gb_32281 [translate_table: standard]